MSLRARVIKRTKEFYAFAIKVLRHGFEGDSGKRQGKLFDGFDASDGFNLHDFNDWTPSQKAKITKAYTAVDKLAARPYKIVRPRNKKNLKRLQEASQHTEKIKGLKVAFVPVADPEGDIKISYTKKAVKIKEGRVGKWFVPLDREKLITDPETEINEKVAANPARVYNIGAEHYIIKKPLYGADALQKEIERLQNKYSSDKFDPGDSNSHYWENWLDGFIAYNYESRQAGLDFRKARRDYKAKFKDKRSKHKKTVNAMIEKRRKLRNKEG